MRFFLFSLCALLALGVTLAMADPKAPMTIPEEFRTCTVDADCILVEMLCSTCCDQDAINAVSQDPFTEMYTHYCSDYDGPVCECTTPDVEPVCTENRCTPFNPFADENGNVSYE
jgi:hypothetical protein